MRKSILVLLIATLGAGLGSRGATAASGPTADPPTALVGVTWELVTLQAAGQPTESVAGTGLTLVLGADGRATGSGGCNQFGGSYTADTNGALTFSPLAATLKGCDPVISAREQRYFTTLPAVRGYALDGSTGLRLTFEQTGLQLAYRRAVPGIPATGGGGSAPARVTGTVTYLQRILLPPSAVVVVQLVDISRQGAPATVLAEQSITTGGNAPPYPFTLPYDTTQIAPTNTYAVQARITVDGQLRFISTQAYLVLTQGRPTSGVEVVVDAVGGGSPGLPSSGGGGMASAESRDAGWLLLGFVGLLLIAARPWRSGRSRNVSYSGTVG